MNQIEKREKAVDLSFKALRTAESDILDPSRGEQDMMTILLGIAFIIDAEIKWIQNGFKDHRVLEECFVVYEKVVARLRSGEFDLSEERIHVLQAGDKVMESGKVAVAEMKAEVAELKKKGETDAAL